MRLQRWRPPSERSEAASRRSRVVAHVASATVRPMTTVLPLSPSGVWLGRRIVAGSLAALSPLLPGTVLQPVDAQAREEGLRVRGEWVQAPGADRSDALVLYVHGSGYAVCSARTHRGLTSRLSAGAGVAVFACDYRLAPRHRFPAAADDVRACYDWLLDQGYPPSRIVLAGDSAGGHLAVDLACQLLRAEQPAPAGMLLLSPLVDLTFELAAEHEQRRRDPLISAARARRLVALYTRDADPADPRLALSVPRGCAWPPTLIQAGGAEMLAADAEHLARSIRAACGDCELQLWNGQMHVFQAFAALNPDARRALTRASAFVRETLPLTDTPIAREESA